MACHERALLPLLFHDARYEPHIRVSVRETDAVIHQSRSLCVFMDWIYGSLLPPFIAIFPFRVYIEREVEAIMLWFSIRGLQPKLLVDNVGPIDCTLVCRVVESHFKKNISLRFCADSMLDWGEKKKEKKTRCVIAKGWAIRQMLLATVSATGWCN